MNKVLELLKETGALQEGHFILSSGKHSNMYCQCAKLFESPKVARDVIKEIVKKLGYQPFDVVVGPAMGGIIAAYELARQTGKRNVFTERVDGEMALRRGFEIKKGERVLICEDVVTTFKSSLEVAKLVESLGGEIVGICAVVNRSVTNIKYSVYSAIEMEIDVYEKDECPLCKSGIEPTKPGSRGL